MPSLVPSPNWHNITSTVFCGPEQAPRPAQTSGVGRETSVAGSTARWLCEQGQGAEATSESDHRAFPFALVPAPSGKRLLLLQTRPPCNTTAHARLSTDTSSMRAAARKTVSSGVGAAGRSAPPHTTLGSGPPSCVSLHEDAGNLAVAAPGNGWGICPGFGAGARGCPSVP